MNKSVKGTVSWLALALISFIYTPALAEIDGHGPDGWRVTGVAVADVLNARMGPGIHYPIIDSFRHNERGLEQITCVPLLLSEQYHKMTPAEIAALPPRWCLMRDRSLHRAGWINAKYVIPDYDNAPAPQEGGDDLITYAEDLVGRLYQLRKQEDQGTRTVLYTRAGAKQFFFKGVDRQFLSGEAGADPVYGAQDFDGSCQKPRRDEKQAMYRGMITVIVNCINFGHPIRTEYSLRVDPDSADRRPRIFRISHDGWSFPE